MKYLVEYTPYKHKQILNSEKELLEFIFQTCGGFDKYIKVHEINEISETDISKLEFYNEYREQKVDLLIKRINNNNLKIAYYEIELSKVSNIECREFKSFLSDKILKLYEDNKLLEEELKQYGQKDT